jgi:group II intron reverse transcriptase/maturase
MEELSMDLDYQADRVWLLSIQRKVYKWSKSVPNDAWEDMWNWITDIRNLNVAWNRVSKNKGARTAGVDKVTVNTIKRRKTGVVGFLEGIQLELRKGEYTPMPVKRILIEKKGKPGKFRPLGIPTVKDRIVQAAILQIIEPVFEGEFLAVSYGFRPGRACRDAIEHIRNAIRPTKSKTDDTRKSPYQWVIEGDIEACFDNIDHHHLMKQVRRRIGDRKVTRLIKAFLKSGILEKGKFVPTKKGTPQGGILSPLLANIALSAIEKRYSEFVVIPKQKNGKPYARPGDALRKKRYYTRKKGRPVFLPVRYADDFVILISGSEEDAKDEVEKLAQMLSEEMKLTLSPDKTRVTSLEEEFEFLGHRIYMKWNDKWGFWPRVEIPKEAFEDIKRKIKRETKRKYLLRELKDILEIINPKLRGWGNFYRHCYGAKAVFYQLDHFVWNRIWKWLKKKYPRTSRKQLYRRYWRKRKESRRRCWHDGGVPVYLTALLKVERHNLKLLRYPAYAQELSESPVRNESRTPGLGTGSEETSASNCGKAPQPYVHLK